MKQVLLGCVVLLLCACASRKKINPLPTPTETKKYYIPSRDRGDEGIAGGGASGGNTATVDEVDAFASEPQIATKKPVKVKKPLTARERLDTAGFRHGKLVYDIPDTMQYKKEYHVVVRIHRDRKCLFIYEGLDNPKEGLIRTGDIMEVTLTDPTGEAFFINKINEGSQIVDSSDFTEWVFHVRPLRSGELKLFLVASIISSGAKRDIVHQNVVYVKTSVQQIVTEQTAGFFFLHWKWLLTALVIPFVIFLLKRRKEENSTTK